LAVPAGILPASGTGGTPSYDGDIRQRHFRLKIKTMGKTKRRNESMP